eukprot:s4361_g1.t1
MTSAMDIFELRRAKHVKWVQEYMELQRTRPMEPPEVALMRRSREVSCQCFRKRWQSRRKFQEALLGFSVTAPEEEFEEVVCDPETPKDQVEDVPVDPEPEPMEIDNVAVKPVDTKPMMDTNPMMDTKPMDTKPMDTQLPMDTKPNDSKPMDPERKLQMDFKLDPKPIDPIMVHKPIVKGTDRPAHPKGLPPNKRCIVPPRSIAKRAMPPGAFNVVPTMKVPKLVPPRRKSDSGGSCEDWLD